MGKAGSGADSVGSRDRILVRCNSTGQGRGVLRASCGHTNISAPRLPQRAAILLKPLVQSAHGLLQLEVEYK
jgi:hypothetical protein